MMAQAAVTVFAKINPGQLRREVSFVTNYKELIESLLHVLEDEFEYDKSSLFDPRAPDRLLCGGLGAHAIDNQAGQGKGKQR